jgi:hypothetical protein
LPFWRSCSWSCSQPPEHYFQRLNALMPFPLFHQTRTLTAFSFPPFFSALISYNPPMFTFPFSTLLIPSSPSSLQSVPCHHRYLQGQRDRSSSNQSWIREVLKPMRNGHIYRIYALPPWSLGNRGTAIACLCLIF